MPNNSKENDPNYVYNPKSKRWIKKDGALAKKLGLSGSGASKPLAPKPQAKAPSVQKPKAKPKAKAVTKPPPVPKPKAKPTTATCPPDKILNPASGRCVSRTGAIGKKLLGTTAKPKTTASAKPKTTASGSVLSDFYAKKDQALKKYPSNKTKRTQFLADLLGIEPHLIDDYEASLIDLDCPNVPIDAISVKYEKEKKALEDNITKNCSECYKFIKGRHTIKKEDLDRWQYMSTVCNNCHEAIGKYYHKKYGAAPQYKTYSKTPPGIDDLMNHGAKQNYYNGTMYAGAKHWANVATRRSIAALPAVPTGKPK